MFVNPLPARGDIVVGRDAVGRVLRVSGHPDLVRVFEGALDPGAAPYRAIAG